MGTWSLKNMVLVPELSSLTSASSFSLSILVLKISMQLRKQDFAKLDIKCNLLSKFKMFLIELGPS